MDKKLSNAKVIARTSLLTVLFVVFGVLISAQLRSLPTRIYNPISPYTSLKQTKESLYSEQEQLKKEIRHLQENIQKFQEQSENTAINKNDLNSLQDKKALAGLTEMSGPGLIINLDDNKNYPVSEESIIHAADMRDLVNVLWLSGAEAISINGQRIVISTSIDCIVNTILINNVRISTPFEIRAVGDKDQMYEKLLNSNLLVNLRQRQKNGLQYSFHKNDQIFIPMFDGSFETKTEFNK